jgi:hypothetical protein
MTLSMSMSDRDRDPDSAHKIRLLQDQELFAKFQTKIQELTKRISQLETEVSEPTITLHVTLVGPTMILKLTLGKTYVQLSYTNVSGNGRSSSPSMHRNQTNYLGTTTWAPV